MHTLYLQAAGISQTIDNSLAKKIETFVKEGVKNDSNLTDCTNRTFFPRPKAIHSHIVDTIRKLRHSKIYQEYLIKNIVKWEKDLPTPSIHVREKVKQNDCLNHLSYFFTEASSTYTLTYWKSMYKRKYLQLVS